ncbi:hypothetical protein HDU91_003032 [Kappamyces sp. JEL0680]|nr:hypothetical protein HDU91_003032 [Kappamyces sp. JEL0680]
MQSKPLPESSKTQDASPEGTPNQTHFNALLSSFQKKSYDLARNAANKTRELVEKQQERRRELHLQSSLGQMNSPAAAAQNSLLQSIFGMPLAEALRKSNQTLGKKERVPRIVARCIEFLDSKGIDEVGIYRLSGSTKDILTLRQQFDTTQDVDLLADYCDPNAVASLFKAYVRELPDCILTGERLGEFSALFNSFDEDEMAIPDAITLKDQHPLVNNPELLDQLSFLLSQLPPENTDFMAVFFSHLKRVAQNYVENKMGLNNLQVVWSPTLHFGGALFMVLVLHCDTLLPIQAPLATASPKMPARKSSFHFESQPPPMPTASHPRKVSLKQDDPFSDSHEYKPPSLLKKPSTAADIPARGGSAGKGLAYSLESTSPPSSSARKPSYQDRRAHGTDRAIPDVPLGSPSDAEKAFFATPLVNRSLGIEPVVSIPSRASSKVEDYPMDIFDFDGSDVSSTRGSFDKTELVPKSKSPDKPLPVIPPRAKFDLPSINISKSPLPDFSSFEVRSPGKSAQSQSSSARSVGHVGETLDYQPPTALQAPPKPARSNRKASVGKGRDEDIIKLYDRTKYPG